MPVITEGLNLGDLLKYEAPNLYSRDQVTIAAGQNLVLGTVVGIDATTAKVKQIDRSEERRVGKECLRLCRSRWSPYH